jgi:hypothetical protein
MGQRSAVSQSVTVVQAVSAGSAVECARSKLLEMKTAGHRRVDYCAEIVKCVE